MWNDDHHLPQDLPPARQQILPEHLPLGSPWRLCPVLACSGYRCACAAPPVLPMPSVCPSQTHLLGLGQKNLLLQLVQEGHTFRFLIKEGRLDNRTKQTKRKRTKTKKKKT